MKRSEEKERAGKKKKKKIIQSSYPNSSIIGGNRPTNRCVTEISVGDMLRKMVNKILLLLLFRKEKKNYNSLRLVLPS